MDPDDTPSAPMHEGTETVEVAGSMIRLGQLLKLAGIAESGGHARALLADGEVRVNGEIEQRRGRQLSTGDEVVVALPGGDHHLRVS